jgi:hypothetical protein
MGNQSNRITGMKKYGQSISTIVHNDQLIRRLRFQMSVPMKVTIRSQSKQGFPVEFEMDNPSIDELNDMLEGLVVMGFKAPVFRTGKESNEGKFGIVESATKQPDGKAYEIVVTLKDGGKASFKSFEKNAFRKGDKLKIIKNERGFETGELVEDDEYGGQQELPL